LHVVVCIKQVPEITEVSIDRRTNTLVREGVPSIINPFDMYAIEEGLRLKEAHGGTVSVISMGPPQVESSLKEAVAMGADRAVLLSDSRFAGADTLATAYTLAQGIRRLGQFDLVICGKQAIDGDTGQVGPGLAEELGIPHVTYVRRIRELGDGMLRVERMVEGGWELISTTLPALISVVKDINEPRLPSLKGIMRAKRTPVTVWGLEELGCDPQRVGLTGSATEVVRIWTPEPRESGELLQGDPEQQARQLVERLRGLGVI